MAALYALLFLYTLFFAYSMIFFHGANDQTISLWHSQALFRAANQPKQLAPIQNGGHNDLLQIGSNGYLLILKNFVDSLLPANNR